MDLPALLDEFLQQPTPDTLWKLHPVLLTLDDPSADIAVEIAGQFFRYINAVQRAMESRQFPVLATALAVGSTGITMAQEIFSDKKTDTVRLSLDGLRVALDILSTYQFVRQWQPAFAAVHDAAVWDLYKAYWKLSVDLQPDLDIDTRVNALESLFTQVRAAEQDNTVRLALLVQLFQLALAARVLPLLIPEKA